MLASERSVPPNHRSPANEVADHDAIAVALADRDLVDADRLRGGRAGALELGAHVLHLHLAVNKVDDREQYARARRVSLVHYSSLAQRCSPNTRSPLGC